MNAMTDLGIIVDEFIYADGEIVSRFRSDEARIDLSILKKTFTSGWATPFKLLQTYCASVLIVGRSGLKIQERLPDHFPPFRVD
jgi:hypothetical protein